jgi:citrate lyase beta subunit
MGGTMASMTDETSDADLRPRRSVLYVPGSKPQALEKAKSLAADSLILDLEDAVAPDEKVAARDQVCAAVKAGGYGERELVIRVNGLLTPWGDDDLNAVADAGPDAVLIPKVYAPAQIEEVEAILNSRKVPASTAIWAMIETPRGVLHAETIAASTPRLNCLVMGTNDLLKDMKAHQTPGREPLYAALGHCVLAARAYGVAIIDGVYNAFKDTEGFAVACAQSVEFGFDGRTLVHPAQIDAANLAFSPSAAALDLAKRQVEAYDTAIKKGEAVAVVDGQIVENLHVVTAKALLAKAALIAAMTKS